MIFRVKRGKLGKSGEEKRRFGFEIGVFFRGYEGLVVNSSKKIVPTTSSKMRMPAT